MKNKRIALLLVVIAVAVGWYWLFEKEKLTKVDRKKALEKRLAEIPFTAESLIQDNSGKMQKEVNEVTLRLKRNEINDSVLSNAMQYLNSLVVGVVRAECETGVAKVGLEIAEFASPNDAYGFYSQVRPAGAPFESLGTESFYVNDTLRFNKGRFVITVTSQTDSNRYEISKSFGRTIEASISERPAPPMFFRLFPYKSQLAPSQKYYSLNFLGVEGLDEVYTVDYAVDEDTLTLFLAIDTAGSKFVILSEAGKDLTEILPAPEEFKYPEQYSFSFEHPEKGRIVTFMANRRLAGIIRYNRATGIELCTMWIQGLQ